jgi:hypothetical protein
VRAAIAFYKGPPDTVAQWIGYWAIRIWTWSRWSHAELVLDGICWSSSARDGGVRGKAIDLANGRWAMVELDLSDYELVMARLWFKKHLGAKYDWLNIGRWLAPFIPHGRQRFVCFEAIGNALGLAGAHRLDADDLYEWALQRAPRTEPQPGGV